MSDIDNVISQLERQRDAIERALTALREIGSDQKGPTPAKNQSAKHGGLSEAGRARIAEAARKRWAAKRAAEGANAAARSKTAKPSKGQITPEGRKRLAESMRKRWAAKRATQAASKAGVAKKTAR